MNAPALSVLRAGRVLPAADAVPLGPSEIRIDAAGRIAAIAPVAAGALTPEEARLLVMPALSDAHDHGRGLRTLACGVADQSLETWLPDLGRVPRVDPWLNAAVALGRLARAGISVVNHCHNTQDGRVLLAEAEAVSRAARDVGVQVAFGWPFFDRNPLVYDDLERFAALVPAELRADVLASGAGMRDAATNMALFEQAKAFEHGGFRLQYHPVAPQWARPETLRAIAVAAARENRRVHMHVLETQAQAEWAARAYPMGLLAWLDDLGLLNDRLTVAHAVWLTPAEIALLARRGVTVSVNLSSNLRLRSGWPAVAEMLAAGVRVAFGLDGMALDDDEDMLRELRLAWHAAAQGASVGAGLDPRRVLQGAFEIGRMSALGPDGGGRIAIGAPADLVALDFTALARDSLVDDPDPVAMLLGRGQNRHVVSVWAGGRQIVTSGALTQIDLPALEADLTRMAREAHAAAPADTQRIATMRAALQRFYAKPAGQR